VKPSAHEVRSYSRQLAKHKLTRGTLLAIGWSGTQTFVQATTSPLLYNSGYNSITLKWNTSEDVYRSIAFYILQIQPNIQSLQRPLELPPSIPRYIMVRTVT
jgi:hypothetical protein